MYYKPACPFGIRLRVALRARGVAFRPVRFRDDETGATAVRAVNGGNEISPTVHVNGIWLTNPTATAVIKAITSDTTPDGVAALPDIAE